MTRKYKDYEARMEKLIGRGTELGDMELLSPEEKAEFTMLSEALDEYGRAYHPLPGRMSTLLTAQQVLVLFVVVRIRLGQHQEASRRFVRTGGRSSL